MIGTPPYMAPEQFKGTVYKESDQYALGCVAYELLTGRIPFQAPDMISMAFLHATETPPSLVQLNATIPPYVEQAVLKAMAKQRADRHVDVYTFIHALQTPIQTSLQQPARAQTRLQLPDDIEEAPSLPISTIAFPPKETKTLAEWLEDGLAHIQAKRYKEALAAYEQAILLSPILAGAHTGRGDALYGLGRYDQALSAYDQAIRLDPKDAIPQNGRGNALKAQLKYQEALQAYQQAIKIDKQFALAYTNKGDIYYTYSIFFTKPTKLDTQLRNYIDSHRTELFAQAQRSNYGQPYERYEPPPSNTAVYHLGLALDAYNAAIKFNPDLALAHTGRGIIFNAQERYPEALAEFQQATRLEPQQADAYHNMGIALRELGMLEAARSAFQQAIQLNSNHGAAYNHLGKTLERLGEHKEAAKAYQRAGDILNPPLAQSESPGPNSPQKVVAKQISARRKAPRRNPPRKKSFFEKLKDSLS